ncbi:MAG: hypothetical protein CML98_08295 [Rhodobiaceae bacterium]|nr:hypothetical protein [Rhodobiaceae bacterium]
MKRKTELFIKAEKVIRSCKKGSHFDSCVKYLTLLATLQPQEDIDSLLKLFHARLSLFTKH